ncbi:MAG: nucleotidyl transferase AbiEii/AbiGii toxin family protein, partial [bacterium]
MNNLLTFTQDRQKALIAQVSSKLNLPAQAIEKDLWVTIVLEALFSLPMSEHFVFKGGTSLSKGWNLITRFSEDIDISLSPEAFGGKYEVEPSHR